jgi:hypothetical protein
VRQHESGAALDEVRMANMRAAMRIAHQVRARLFGGVCADWLLLLSKRPVGPVMLLSPVKHLSEGQCSTPCRFSTRLARLFTCMPQHILGPGFNGNTHVSSKKVATTQAHTFKPPGPGVQQCVLCAVMAELLLCLLAGSGWLPARCVQWAAASGTAAGET